MKLWLKTIIRISLTATIVAAAVYLGYLLWVRYMDTPWTRDGRVRADIVSIAPDVAGLVTKLMVKDNQYVKQGDILFVIDNERYQHSVEEAQAMLDQRKAIYEMKHGQAKRRALLDDQVISQENKEDTDLVAIGAKAEYQQALANLEHARLNLARTVIRSPVDGWVTNLLVRSGDYAQVGSPKLAVIDQHSYWVYGYFEEHKLRFIHTGDAAEVRMMGTNLVLHGHVESLAHGITDRDNPTDVRLLANVNPSFNWVRLAQRIPVRIHLDVIPQGINLVAGMTCTVVVKPK